MRRPIKLIGSLAIIGVLTACGGQLAGQTAAPTTRPTTQPVEIPTYAPPPTPVTPADHAVHRAIGFLLKQIDDDGKCAGEFGEDNPRHGGLTALCVYALLTAEVDYRQPEVKRALKWLGGIKMKGTYAVAMRACALAVCNDKNVVDALKADITWLVKAADTDGRYGYESADGKPLPQYDNSNAHLARKERRVMRGTAVR